MCYEGRQQEDNMPTKTTSVTIPNVELSLDQLLIAIRKLDESSLNEIGQVLLETAMDAKLARMIEELAVTPPVDEISDAEIQAEIRTVRRSPR
jgi:hypothetical protein